MTFVHDYFWIILHIILALCPQDSGRLLDFDYSDEDIDSLRKQMKLPEPQSPASSLSDELEALGTRAFTPYFVVVVH